MDHSRRNFIKKSLTGMAGLTLATTVPQSLNAMSSRVSASDSLNVGLIGCKGMGFANLRDHLKVPGVKCVALCDVDKNILESRASDVEDMTGEKPKLYRDFRRLIENKDIDIVIIGTPDHWHCLPMVMACQEGKDVYVEKPLANSIEECNIMAAAAKKYNRVVQVGQQQRSGKHWKEAIDVIHAGRLGEIRKVHFWCNFFYGAGPRAVPNKAVPDGVDYDMWLGPAPKRPFNPNRFHGSWRMFWDYGGGLQTDWGVHLVDMGLWALNITETPKSVTAMGGNFAAGDRACETADTQTTMFEFNDFHLTWDHNGGIQTGPYNRNYGIAFIGEKGTIVADRNNWVLNPEEQDGKKRMEEIPKHESDGKTHINHVENFIECVKTREKPACDVETARRAALFTHLGNIAYRTGKKLYYDEEKNEFPYNPPANDYLVPEYRDPWNLPKIS